MFALPNLTRILALCTQVFGRGEHNSSSLVPIFGGWTKFMYTKDLQTLLLALQLIKIDASPIFVVPKNYAKFGIDSGTTKNGVALIFLNYNTSKCVCACFVCIKLVRPPNMGSKFLAERILYPKPCCQKCAPKIGVYFWQHGFGCQIRSVGS